LLLKISHPLRPSGLQGLLETRDGQLEREVRQMTITIQCLNRQLAAAPQQNTTQQLAIDLLDFD
jgi:hypothetical protein